MLIDIKEPTRLISPGVMFWVLFHHTYFMYTHIIMFSNLHRVRMHSYESNITRLSLWLALFLCIYTTETRHLV